MTGDSERSQWICFNMIDEVLCGTTKVDGVSSGMDNGEDVNIEKQHLIQ